MTATNTVANESRSEQSTLTGQVVDHLRGIDELPPEAVEGAKHCILDTLGVAIAGSREPVSTAVLQTVLDEGGAPRVAVWGINKFVSPGQAALVNGTAAHALDFDDVSAAMEGHPSAPVVPALLAAAQEARVTGHELIKAFIIGFEAEAMIGRLMSPSHYARGFHTTATVGTFGAAAASSYAFGLDRGQWLNAFGIAGSQASGLKSMFGSMTKPLQVGAAAESGLRAALLSRAGVTANGDVMGVSQGFRDTQSEEIAELPPWSARPLAVTEVLFKHHAACYLTHSAIEGLLAMRKDGLDLAQVQSVEIQVPPGHLSVCNIQTPTTPLEAKFSLRMVAALALATGDLSERAFNQEILNDPQLMNFLQKVHIIARPDDARSSIVVVTDSEDKQYRSDVDVNSPTPKNELPSRWDSLVRKFEALVDPILGKENSSRIVQVVGELDRLDNLGLLENSLSGEKA